MDYTNISCFLFQALEKTMLLYWNTPFNYFAIYNTFVENIVPMLYGKCLSVRIWQVTSWNYAAEIQQQKSGNFSEYINFSTLSSDIVFQMLMMRKCLAIWKWHMMWIL